MISGDKKVNLPILQCHGIYKYEKEIYTLLFYIGDQDPLVQLKWARLTEERLNAMGFKQYTFKEYRTMGHSSCDQVKYFIGVLNRIVNIYFFLGNERYKFIYCQKLTQN